MNIQINPGRQVEEVEKEERPTISIPERKENPNFGGNEPGKVDPTRIKPEPGKQQPSRQDPWKNDPTRITRENDPEKTDPTRTQ